MNVNRLNLGLKFSIAVTALIVLTMIGVATLIINYQKESLRQNTFESNFALTRNLAEDAVEPFLVFDPLRLDKLVHTVRDATSCAYAMLVDANREIVAHTNRRYLGTSLDPTKHSEVIRALTDDREHIWEYEHEDEPVKEFSVPVKIGNEIFGIATVGFSISTINAGIEARIVSLKNYIYVITAIMVLSGIAGAFIVSNLLTRPLQRLKNTMLDVQSGNLDVVVENPKLVKCTERLHCTKRDCPAYDKERCWAIAGTFCHGEVQGTFAQKIGDCRNCVVYKESCGDEINELVEVFNQMIADLRYNLQELEKANMEKAQMERLSALGEMATTIAHETKNPLNSIRVAASYLKKNFQGELLTEFLSIIEEEVMRLNEMTSNFLGFSRPAPLNMNECTINEIVRSTVDLIRQEATERNIEVILLTDEHVPPVLCDFGRIKQALLNLLINAMDASKEGDSITINTDMALDQFSISVQDTGKGIGTKELENIFKPFYTTKTRGSGLGLAIVERIVKEHQGNITVDSDPGKGTTVTLTIPIRTYANV